LLADYQQLLDTRISTLGSMKIELPEIRPEDRTPLVEALPRVRQAGPVQRGTPRRHQESPHTPLEPVQFWDSLQDQVRGLGQIPRLADLIRQKGQEATTKNAAAVLV